MTPRELFDLLYAAVGGQWARTIATLVVVGTAFATTLLIARVLRFGAIPVGAPARRRSLVWLKNGVWALALVLVAGIWASSIAGVALSLAAVVGAMLIVSKELIGCALGYGVITLSRPYDIGDFVEMGGHAGRVIDVDLFNTTLAETGAVHQLTGKTVSVPNNVVFSSAVRNVSATGRYMVDLYRIVVPADVDLAAAEAAALEAAREVCRGWKDEADRHLAETESRSLFDLPSAREKVLWEPIDAKAHGLVVRFACPVEERVAAEQSLFRGFWARYGAALAGASKASSPSGAPGEPGAPIGRTARPRPETVPPVRA